MTCTITQENSRWMLIAKTYCSTAAAYLAVITGVHFSDQSRILKIWVKIYHKQEALLNLTIRILREFLSPII